MTRKFMKSDKKKKSLVKKILKWTGITFLLLLIAVIALPFIFKDKLVEIVKQEVNNSVNAKVDFGDFDLTLFSSFPNFSFDIQDVTVTGVDEFEGVILANIKNTGITLDLMSIINGGKIKIKSVVIDKPTFHVIVNKDSLANYDIAKSSEEDTVVVEDNAEPTQYEIGLKELKIIDANITYIDSVSNMSSEIKNLNFDLSGDFTQDNFDVISLTKIEELTFSEGIVNYLHKTNVELKADVNIDKFIKYTLKENNLKLNQLDIGFDGWLELLEDKTNIDMTFNSKKTDFKSILSLIPAVYSKDFNSIKTNGNLALNGAIKGSVEGESLPSFDIKMAVDNGYFKYPDMPNSADNINIKTEITHPQGNLDKMKIDVSKFHVELANNPIDGFIKVSTPISDPNIVSNIKADIDLDKLKTVIPMEEKEKLNGLIHADLNLAGKMSSITNEQYQDFKADGELTVKDMLYSSKNIPYEVKVNTMLMDFSPQYVNLKELDTKVGNSDIKANGKIDNILPYIFNSEVLKGSMYITSNKLDVDDLTREVEGGEAQPEANSEVPEESTSSSDSSQSVILVPSYYDMKLTTNIKELIYDGLSIKNVTGSVSVKDEIAQLSNLSMDMLQGNVLLNGSYSTKQKNPKVDFDYKIKGVDIEETANFFKSIETIAPIAKHCKGKISTNMKVVTDLDKNMEPVYNSITGNGGLFSNDLTVTGVKALKEFARVLKLDQLATQKLKGLKLAFEFKEGRAFTKPFDIKLSGIPTNVEGSTGFDQTISYHVNMDVPREKLGSKANEVAEGLMGKVNIKGVNIKLPSIIPVSFTIGGTVTNPKIKSNIKGQAQNVVEDLKQKAVDTVKAVVNQGIDKAMEEARKRADQLRAEAKVQADKLRAEGEKLTQQAKAKADELEKQAKAKADEEAEKLANSGGNMFEKMAKKKAAEIAKKKAYEKIAKSKNKAYQKAEIPKKQAEDKASKLEAEADKQAKKVIEAAQVKANSAKQ